MTNQNYKPDTPEKEIVYRYMVEAWGNGDLTVVDEVVAEDVIDHDPFPGQKPGREGWKQAALMIRKMMPDMRVEIADMVQDNNRIAVRYLCLGTFTGEYPGRTATNKPVLIRGLGIEQIRNGKMSETHRLLEINFDYDSNAESNTTLWDSAAKK